MIIVRIVQFVKIVQLVQLDYYGYIKFFGVFVGTWVGAFTQKLLPIGYKQTFDKKKDPDSLETPDHQGHSLF